MAYRDRVDAGRRLGEELARRGETDVVVLGLPRGGVPVAFQVARMLGAPLDVLVVRKLGLPSQPELAMGAVGEDGTRVLNPEVIRESGIGPEQLAAVEAAERATVQARAARLRGDRPRVPLAGRTALIVDDGIATGSTARVACAAARTQGASRVVVAAPVAPRQTVGELAGYADAVVCLDTPRWFGAVGQFYDDFRATGDDEVARLLAEAPLPTGGGEAAPGEPAGDPWARRN